MTYSCQCYQIGGPFIAEDPDCPAHGTEAQARANAICTNPVLPELPEPEGTVWASDGDLRYTGDFTTEQVKAIQLRAFLAGFEAGRSL